MAGHAVEDESSYLVVILDCNAFYWSPKYQEESYKNAKQEYLRLKEEQKQNGRASKPLQRPTKPENQDFSKILNTFLVYFNAFLTLHRGNKLAVFGITPKHSSLLYCSPISKINNKTSNDNNRNNQNNSNNNSNNNNNNNNNNDNSSSNNENHMQQDSEFSFSDMNAKIKSEVKNLLEKSSKQTEETSNFGKGSLLAGALSHSLCLLNRIILKDLPSIEPRILVAYASQDVSNQYIPIMNCIFCATKRNIAIDTVMLRREESRFLQQSADKTGGIYSRPITMDGLLQHLLMTHLSPLCVRKHLCKPDQKNVDFRVSCFCHQKTIDIGFVCPICLSIFCQRNATCRTCGSRFSRKKVLSA